MWVAAAAALIGVVGLVLGASALTRLRRLRADQQVLLDDGASVGVVERQAEIARLLDALAARLDALDGRIGAVGSRTDEALATSVRRHGLVRYNAFGDQGGHQSWSLALLDADDSGIVVTGLLGREETHMYVKQLRAGVPDRELSDEEAAAVRAATETSDGR